MSYRECRSDSSVLSRLLIIPVSEMSTSFCRSPEFQYWGDTDYPNTQQSALSSHDMAYGQSRCTLTINPEAC